MQNFIIPVNNEALSRALVAVAGEETAALICKAYRAIDEAMQFGYQRGAEDGDMAGFKRGYQDAEAAAKASVFTPEEYAKSQSYGIGYEDGYEAATNIFKDEVDQENFDEGYAEGVHDARVRPEMADDYLDFLVGKETELLDEDFDSFDPSEYTLMEDGSYVCSTD